MILKCSIFLSISRKLRISTPQHQYYGHIALIFTIHLWSQKHYSKRNHTLRSTKLLQTSSRRMTEDQIFSLHNLHLAGHRMNQFWQEIRPWNKKKLTLNRHPQLLRNLVILLLALLSQVLRLISLQVVLIKHPNSKDFQRSYKTRLRPEKWSKMKIKRLLRKHLKMKKIQEGLSSCAL